MLKKLYLFVYFFGSIHVFGCDQLLLTKTLKTSEQVLKDHISLHQFLYKKVFSEDKRNRFACAFKIKTSAQKIYVLYVDIIKSQKFKAPLDFYAKIAKEETKGESYPALIQAAGKVLPPKKNSPQQLTFTLSEQIFQNGVFMNADKIPLYCLQQENIEICKMFPIINQYFLSFVPLMQRLFFSSITLFCDRMEKDKATYRCYNSDSELHALYVLQCMVDDISIKIANLVPEGEKIVKIEFHGCTTRDMCPLCYTNMNCMQFLANQKQGVGFLGALLERLNMMGCGDASINSATFISSLEKFPSSGNLLWDIDESVSAIEPGFVYQFRFTEPEITAIKDLSEEILKRAADITDLSSLSVSPEEESTSAAAKPFTVSSEIGTPPHSTERPETIPAKLKKKLATARYRIQDVPGDGNCAFYAYALSVGIKASSSELREAAYSALENFRKKRQEDEDEDEKEVMDELAKRLQKDKEWVGVDDLKWLGQSQTRDIIIIQPNYDNPEQIFIHNPTAQNENPLAVELPIKQLSIYIKQHNGSVFLYYNGVNHFQAIVPQ